MDISVLIHAVHARFKELSEHELFVVNTQGSAERRQLEEVYLAAWPEGTNPIYITRTEHDCSCCRHFIRSLGSVVAIIDGKMQTIWDVKDMPYPFDVVAKALHDHVMQQSIVALFRTNMSAYGVAEEKQRLGDGTYKTWNHFNARVASRHKSVDIGKDQHTFDRQLKLMVKGFESTNDDGIVQLLMLIDNDAIDRAKHMRDTVVQFNDLRKQYLAIESAADRHLFAVRESVNNKAVGSLINNVLGMLLTDLCEGQMSLENAINKYMIAVDPTNIHRSHSLVSAVDVANTMKKVRELGVEEALERRMANMHDVRLTDVLWASGEAQSKMRTPLEEMLYAATRSPEVKTDHASDMSVEEFMAKVLPTASAVEVLVKNSMVNNLMTLTAPVHADAKRLFKWDNGIGWSYNGNTTDSIKERVKAAGGNVQADLRVSLSWHNTDDLDLHCSAADGQLIYFRNKCGILDVDMNSPQSQLTTNPVENMSWMRPKDGIYSFYVDNYQTRNTSNFGFTLEVESDGKVQQFTHERAVKKLANGQTPHLVLQVQGGKVVDVRMGDDLFAGNSARDIWGIKTENFVPVDTVMLSPNYWNGQKIGHQHWFFILKGCKNDQPTRGIYNEYLDSDLRPHRKVFELMGEKSKCPVVDDQLSGIGFSTSRHDVVIIKARVAGAERLFNVQF